MDLMRSGDYRAPGLDFPAQLATTIGIGTVVHL